MALDTPTQRGSYRIETLIGTGGMGEVYRARDLRLERPVAIKVLAHAPDAEEARARLLAEARATCALNHPHICTIYEVGEFDGQPFIAMEFVEGRVLTEVIPPDGLPTDAVSRYGVQVAEALATRARPRHRPSRSQERERHRHVRWPREDPGLRSGDGPRAGTGRRHQVGPGMGERVGRGHAALHAT
jgi:serine/threonine protein kinase